jgi:hypothetical protein
LTWALVICPATAWLFWYGVTESDALFLVLPAALAAVGTAVARRSAVQTIVVSVLASAAPLLSVLALVMWESSRGAFQ